MTATPLWWDEDAPDGVPRSTRRPPLDGDTVCDVAVVGGGSTGLWAAYYLLEEDPSLDVVVVEADTIGSGAAGRHGGWCDADVALSPAALARRHGPDAARSLRAALRDAVVEVGGVAAAEQIDCGFRYGGALTLARTPAEVARLTAAAADSAHWGDELHLLDPQEVGQHVRTPGVLSGAWTPDCALLHPVRLVQGLAHVVEQRGARVVEGTRAQRLSPRAVVTDGGTVRARWIVRTTEGWTADLAGASRTLAPAVAYAAATERLPAAIWADLGWDGGQVLAAARRAALRARRTDDGRIVLVQGTPVLRPARRVAAGAAVPGRVRDHLHRALAALLPGAADHGLSHVWSGPVALTRDDHPSIGVDVRSGTAWAGGFGVHGVAAANLAGRTLADLVTGADTARPAWVGHRSPTWPRGPVRRGLLTATRWARGRATGS